MANRADDMIDRRRLRRKLTFWRIVTVVVAALAIAGAASWIWRDEYAGASVNHIAKVRIDGTITQDDELIDRLEEVRKSPLVKGVILAINSPGGTTVGGETIFTEVRKLAADKPVVAQVGTLAASAGYMIATAADHIVAHKTSIVGSIGVLVQIPNVSKLMDNLGIQLDEVKSSPLKAEPSPFNPTTEDEKAMIRSMILDSYDWFVGLVTDRRPLTREEVQKLADGSIFTGRQAVTNKLIDEVGGEQQAIDWLATKGVDADLKVIEWKADKDGSSLFFAKAMVRHVVRALGLPAGTADIIDDLSGKRIFLDGLLSVWHPENSVSGD